MVETLNITINKNPNSKLDQVDFDNIQFGKIYTDHLFVAEFKNGEWDNFQINPYDDLRISPASPSIHYGISIFEGLKAYKNDKGEVLVFRPDKNLERMNISAERMCMPLIPEQLYYEALDTLLGIDSEDRKSVV